MSLLNRKGSESGDKYREIVNLSEVVLDKWRQETFVGVCWAKQGEETFVAFRDVLIYILLLFICSRHY